MRNVDALLVLLCGDVARLVDLPDGLELQLVFALLLVTVGGNAFLSIVHALRFDSTEPHPVFVLQLVPGVDEDPLRPSWPH